MQQCSWRLTAPLPCPLLDCRDAVEPLTACRTKIVAGLKAWLADRGVIPGLLAPGAAAVSDCQPY
jgi:hypothetical protein